MGTYITCLKELDIYTHSHPLGSWRDGLGFNALIHAHRPDIIDYNSLVAKNHIHNLNNAFNVAHDELGIAKILDAEGEFWNRWFLSLPHFWFRFRFRCECFFAVIIKTSVLRAAVDLFYYFFNNTYSTFFFSKMWTPTNPMRSLSLLTWLRTTTPSPA